MGIVDRERIRPRTPATRHSGTTAGAFDLEPPHPRRRHDDVVVERTRRALRLAFGPLEGRTFAVRYWNGTLDAPMSSPRFTLVLTDPGSLRTMLLPPSELRLGESYIRGVFDVDGDLEAAQSVADELLERLSGTVTGARLLSQVARLPHMRAERAVGRMPRRRWRRHSQRRDAAAIRSHYDVSNEFYSLWLDRRRVYSCAYFETGTEDIDTAQDAKLDLLCRKLRLRPGERLLDIGCGWGGLIAHAAANYGVRALGITLSQAQAAGARQAIAAAGVADRCEVQVRDYRALSYDHPFDKVVSVGMFEHVGRDQLQTYTRHAFSLTAPGGLFLNSGIVAAPRASGLRPTLQRRLWHAGAFIDRYVFPDGELVRLGELIECAEAAGFDTRDVENLREHYARTLRLWVERLERARSEALRLVDVQIYRTWRLYMAASAHAFSTGRLSLAHALFARRQRGGAVSVPWTRRALYGAPGA